jgi:xylulokinase
LRSATISKRCARRHRISRVTAIGGGSRSRYWLASIATALGVPVDLPGRRRFRRRLRCGPPRPDRGDRRRPGCGLHAAANGWHDRAGHVGLTPAYEEAYRRYRALYPAIKSLAH